LGDSFLLFDCYHNLQAKNSQWFLSWHTMKEQCIQINGMDNVNFDLAVPGITSAEKEHQKRIRFVSGRFLTIQNF
jgi:hypothetical protein